MPAFLVAKWCTKVTYRELCFIKTLTILNNYYLILHLSCLTHLRDKPSSQHSLFRSTSNSKSWLHNYNDS
ncbi:hypothetical protein BDV3_006437 [Batrachochytrium dendrobatidis]